MGGWLSPELRQLWGDLTAASNGRVMEEEEPGSSLPAGKMKGNRHEVKNAFQVEYKDIISPHENTQRVGWAAQRGCPVSVLGVFQDPIGGYPEQPGLISQLLLLWVGGWARGFLMSPPALSNLRFCDPMVFQMAKLNTYTV